jgi:hypothetical protein
VTAGPIPPASMGPVYHVAFSEGPACRVRCARWDYPFRFIGHDRHAPPIVLSAGPVYQVRRAADHVGLVGFQLL